MSIKSAKLTFLQQKEITENEFLKIFPKDGKIILNELLNKSFVFFIVESSYQSFAKAKVTKTYILNKEKKWLKEGKQLKEK